MRTICQECGKLIDITMIYRNSYNTAGSPPTRAICKPCYVNQMENREAK